MKKTFSLLIALLLASTAFAQTQIIAHRGYHAKNSTDNSISALKNAQDIKVYVPNVTSTSLQTVLS